MEHIKTMIINQNKDGLIKKYNELLKKKIIKPLTINQQIYNSLNYLPTNKRVKMSITIDFDNELEYWMWLASPLLYEYLVNNTNTEY